MYAWSRAEFESTMGGGATRRSTRRKEPNVQSSNPKRMASRVSGGAEVGWAAADIGVALAAAVAADTARSIPSIAVAPRRSNVAALAASSSDMSSVSVRKAATATGEKRGAARVPADGAAGGGGAECGAPLIVLVRSSGSTGDADGGFATASVGRRRSCTSIRGRAPTSTSWRLSEGCPRRARIRDVSSNSPMVDMMAARARGGTRRTCTRSACRAGC